MLTKSYGIRGYKTSEKTKRPSNKKMTEEEKKEIDKRNSYQKRLYITLENIDEIFSDNDRFPVNYNFLFNFIQGKVTKTFNTRNYDRKKEISYDCMNRLYSIMKRKLLKIESKRAEGDPQPVLFFYLSQFFRYVNLLVFGTVFWGTRDQKYILQELEDSSLIEELINIPLNSTDKDDISIIIDKSKYNDVLKIINENKFLNNREKDLICKIYKSNYFLDENLSKKDKKDILLLKEKLQLQPGILQDLEDMLHA